jgi:hypothetical protein
MMKASGIGMRWFVGFGAALLLSATALAQDGWGTVNPSQPAAAQPAALQPAATQPAATTPAAAEPTAPAMGWGTTTQPGTAPAAGWGGTGELANQERCQAAGKSLVVASVVIDLCAVLLGVFLWWLMSRKAWMNGGLRFALPLLLFAAGATVLVALDPFADQTRKACLASLEFAKYVTLSSLASWVRGLVLGAAPTIGAYALGVMLMSVLGARGRR